jgi:ABC-type polysaccharide/polyol phosphate transport system ATPase subunit
MDEFMKTAGILVIATHGMDMLRQFCNKGIFLERGRLVEFGDVDTVIAAYERSIT